MVKKLSKRARGYMLAYMALESSNNDVTLIERTYITHNMIERMKKSSALTVQHWTLTRDF